MKKIAVLAVMMCFAFAAVVFAATIPADKATIDLKAAWSVSGNQKPVMFKHQVHGEKNTCEACHGTPDGNSKLKPAGDIKGTNDKNPAHAWCLSCHSKKADNPNVPKKTACVKCHVK